MTEDNSKKQYSGYNFNEVVRLQPAYKAGYTKPIEPAEPVDVPFGEMYFGQTEGIRPSNSYKDPAIEVEPLK